MSAGRCRGVCLLLGAMLSSLGGCSFGPRVIRSNTLRYNDSVVLTEKEQFLLNLVRLRYTDRPKILGISNITTAFNINAVGPGNARVNSGWGDPFQASVTDLPTISFSPLGGAEFTLGLLMPIAVERVVLLANTGWDLDRVLRLLAHTINGLENVPHPSGQGAERAPQFAEFLFVARQLGELHQRGLAELATEQVVTPLSEPMDDKQLRPEDVVVAAKNHYEFHRTGNDDRIILTEKKPIVELRIAPPAWNAIEMVEVARLLHLTPGLPSYRLLPGDEGQFKGLADPSRAELKISTRSILGAAFYLSKGVEVPPQHYEEGLVHVATDEQGRPFDWGEVMAGLFRVRVQKKKPACAFAAVKHCGYWFYIPNDDLTSKATFVMMMELFDLQIAPGVPNAPVLTLPVTGVGRGGR